MSLRDLYQEMIVDHGKSPRNFGELNHANRQQIGHNPLCGDRIMIYVKENKDTIDAIQFTGVGCAICMASASLMTETVKGKHRKDIDVLFKAFHELVTTGKESNENLGKLAIFSGVSEFPVRVKCATLAWHTLQAALNHQVTPVTTE